MRIGRDEVFIMKMTSVGACASNIQSCMTALASRLHIAYAFGIISCQSPRVHEPLHELKEGASLSEKGRQSVLRTPPYGLWCA